jgi:hypothetical protein
MGVLYKNPGPFPKSLGPFPKLPKTNFKKIQKIQKNGIINKNLPLFFVLDD